MTQVYAVKGFIGLGFETTYGTAVARSKFDRFIEAEITRSHGQAYTQTSRDLAPESASLGEYDPRFRIRAEARPENLAHWVTAWCGKKADSVVSAQQGGTAAYDHTITPVETAQPITLEKRLGTLNKSTLLDGGVATELGFEFANNVLAWTLAGPGRKDTIDNAPSVASYETKRPLAKHEATVTLGGSTVGIRSLRWTGRRTATEDDYETGSRYRKSVPVGPIEVTTEFELLLKDLALIKRSLGGASATTPQDDPLYNADKITVTSTEEAAAAHPYRLEIDMPRCHWEAIGEASRAGEGMMQRVRGRALYDVATGYTTRFKVKNTQTSIA